VDRKGESFQNLQAKKTEKQNKTKQKQKGLPSLTPKPINLKYAFSFMK
jgi:hypothetical protein